MPAGFLKEFPEVVIEGETVTQVIIKTSWTFIYEIYFDRQVLVAHV